MEALDSYLDGITSYRLARNGLAALAGIAIAAAFFGFLPYTALQMLLSLVVLVAAARLANSVFALFAKAAPLPDSATITGLTLFFILAPLRDIRSALLLVFVTSIAMLSKYLLAPHRRHVFNPAAFGVFIFAIAGSSMAIWWVAAPILFPFVLVIALLFVRKMRRFDVFFSFLGVAVIISFARALLSGVPIGSALAQLLFSSPLLFVGGVMLMDPQTMPNTADARRIFGGIVGGLYPLAFQFGPIAGTPEFALLAGNLFAYLATLRARTTMTLMQVVPLTRDTFEFLFVPDRPFHFAPGYHAEWTVPHRSVDSRGNRRMFAFASAPEDPSIRIVAQIPVEGSTFTTRLGDLTKGASVSVTRMTGEPMLPRDPNQKIGVLAVGMGIAPFMSAVRHLAEQHERRDIALIYNVSSPLDFAYQSEIDSVKEDVGLSVFYLPMDFTELSGWQGEYGYVTEQRIKEHVPDFKERIWHIAGPTLLVDDYLRMLQKMGVSRNKIKVVRYSL